MKKYYLLSGSETNLNAKFLTFLKDEMPQKSFISFLALSFDDYEANDMCYAEIQKQFYNAGITFQKSCLIDGRTPRESAQKTLRASNVIFIISPCKTTNFEVIEAYGLIPILKDFEGIIVGLGDAIVNMNEKVSYIENDELIEYNGLGITNYHLVENLDFKDLQKLKDIFKISKTYKVLALVGKAFIKIVDGKEEFFGEYYYFDKEEFLFDGASYDKIKHKGTIKLETERLILRRTTKEDIDEFFFIQLNPKLRKYLGPTKIGNNFEKNRRFFDSQKYEEKDYYRWTIETKKEGKLLGTIYLNIHDEKAKTAGIDYWIREDEWGKGYTTEASKCIMEFAFDELDLNKIESCGAKDNLGTWKVMEKIGLKYEGERPMSMFYYYGGIQTLVLYGLTKKEYLKNKKQAK